MAENWPKSLPDVDESSQNDKELTQLTGSAADDPAWSFAEYNDFGWPLPHARADFQPPANFQPRLDFTPLALTDAPQWEYGSSWDMDWDGAVHGGSGVQNDDSAGDIPIYDLVDAYGRIYPSQPVGRSNNRGNEASHLKGYDVDRKPVDTVSGDLGDSATQELSPQPIHGRDELHKREASKKPTEFNHSMAPQSRERSSDSSTNAASPGDETVLSSARIEHGALSLAKTSKAESLGFSKHNRACERCRSRKTRCNYKQPCASCSMADVECTYSSSHWKLLLSSAYVHSLEDKVKELQGMENKVKVLEEQLALQKNSRLLQDAGTQTEDLRPDESWASDFVAGTSIVTSPLVGKDGLVPTVPRVGKEEELPPVSEIVPLSPQSTPADSSAHHMRKPKGQSWNILLSRVLRPLRPRARPGHQRIEWVCSCGHDMYGDYAAAETDMTESTLVHTLPDCKVVQDSQYNRQQLDRVPKRCLVVQILLGIAYPPAAIWTGEFADLIAPSIAVQLLPFMALATDVTLWIYSNWRLPPLSTERRQQNHQTLTSDIEAPQSDSSSDQNQRSSGVDTSGNKSAQQATSTTTSGVGQDTNTKAGVSSTAGHTQTIPDPVTQPNTGATFTIPQWTLRPSYFELCINQGRTRTSLCEIKLNDLLSKRIATDLELFARVRQEYDAFRRRSVARLLYQPCDIEFVRFHVQRAGYHTGVMDRPLSIPPKSEVEASRYHYYECPMDPLPPIDKRTFFHYFWEHASHPKSSGNPAFDALFFNRLPKKLGASILEQKAAGLQLGWGVHIIEGPNKPLLAWLATVILVLSFAVSLSYDIVYKNKESGFGIGQWMVAVLGTALTALYFHLADMA